MIIEAWLAGLLHVCVSNALAYEYVAVLSHKLSESRWQPIKPVVGALLSKVEFVTVYYSWRPVSPDPGDDHVIDCAMNAAATVVTFNIKDFALAEKKLGLRVITPVSLVSLLANFV